MGRRLLLSASARLPGTRPFRGCGGNILILNTVACKASGTTCRLRCFGGVGKVRRASMRNAKFPCGWPRRAQTG